MKKPNKTVIRKEIKKGEFTAIPTSILHDQRLSGNAFRVLVSILSDADSFRISPSLIQKRLGLSENTIRAVFQQLKGLGYMRIQYNDSNQYNHYIISEFGNLNTISSDHVPRERDPGTILQEPESNIAEKNDTLLKSYLLTIIQYFDFSEVEVSFTRLHEKHSKELGYIDFYPFRNAMNKVIDEFRKDIYTGCMSATENKGKPASRKAVTAYSNWLKDEVFNKKRIPMDYEKKWMHFKLKYTHYSTDFETETADRREQDFYDSF